MRSLTTRLSIAILLGGVSLAGLPGAAQAQLLFQDQGDVLPQGCNGSGCWTNYARVVDFDGDGDLDLVGVNNSGLFGGPNAQPLLAWTNNGTGTFAAANGTFGNLVAALREVAFGDVDGDGDLDMYAPSVGGDDLDRLFIQTAPGVYADQAATRLPAGLSSDAGATRMGDLDNDGDLDLVVANGYTNDSVPTGKLYTNDGSGVFTLSSATYPQTSNLTNPDDIDIADFDRDFDLDILINAHQGQNALWINDGSGNFTDASANLTSLAGGNHYGPGVCDVDGDGDLDFLVDNVGGSYLEHLAINDGNGVFTDATSQITGNTVNADDNIVACADVDNDGDFDFVVGSLSSPTERLFRNDGAGNFAFVSGAVSGPGDSTLWMEFGDLNGDDRLDFMTAQGEGTEDERIYFGTADVPVDDRAPVIIAREEVTLSSGATTTVHFAVYDNAVTDEGPRLSDAYLQVGAEQFPAKYVGGDVYRAVAPMTAETEYNVCATDLAGNKGCWDPSGEGGGGEGGNGNGGNGNGGSPSSGGNGEGASGGAGGGGDGGDTGGDDGCGCSVPGQSPSALGGLALLGLAALLTSRRGGSRPRSRQ